MKPKTKSESISVEEYRDIATQKEPVRKRQIEKRLQMDFGKILFGFEKFNKFSPHLIKYSYIANGEVRPGEVKQVMNKKGKLVKKHISRVGAELKIKGVRKGIFDYYFCIQRTVLMGPYPAQFAFEIWLEAKAPDGKMTKDQLEFKRRADGVDNIAIYEFRSVHEAVAILEKEGIITK